MTSRAHSSSFFSFPGRRDSSRIRFSWGDFTVHHSSNTPLRVRPREISGAFLPRQRWGFFQGGVFSGHDPSIGKRGHKNLPPPRWISVSRTRIARRPSSPRGTSARSSDRPRLSECPTDRPRRLGDVRSVRVRKERPRACGRSGASPRAMRARRPPFLDALARTSWCVRSDRGGARARGSGSVPNVDARVSRRRARGARGGDDGGERCGE